MFGFWNIRNTKGGKRAATQFRQEFFRREGYLSSCLYCGYVDINAARQNLVHFHPQGVYVNSESSANLNEAMVFIAEIGDAGFYPPAVAGFIAGKGSAIISIIIGEL